MSSLIINSQNQIVSYAGGAGSEIFNDVLQLSNGHFIVVGAADDMNWIPKSASIVSLTNPGITNTSGTRTAFLIEFDSTLQKILKVYRLPSGAAQDFRFIKVTNLDKEPTGAVYISGSTSYGYFIGRLNNNFVSGSPTGFQWVKNVSANSGSYQKDNQPWDVGSDGKVVYATGESHGYNWAAIHRVNNQGIDEIVTNWRIHWKAAGGEFYGKASDYPGGISGLLYSGIVFKRDATRCDLRSTNQADYDLWQPDGNGGTKKGKWPLDVLFNGPCDPGKTGNNTSGPGYTGYSPAPIATYGPSSIAIDKRNNFIYIGFNAKSTLPGGMPDFEPAVMAMDNQGELLWWSRLYHEKRADGSLHLSSPDQYVDALAIDYSLPLTVGNLVVGARCHGNNTENFWEGNTIKAAPSASGFQNNFTGNTGDIHISWIGKLSLLSGTLKNSTYMAEYADNTGNLGKAHPDPNLDGWPNPNEGWPTVNTTRTSPNTLKVTADGSVIVLGKGRRTITTANAWQKMIKPGQGTSAWNSFVRMYSPDLSKPLYSSLIVGKWNTATGADGDNVLLCGAFKTTEGIVVVGQHNGGGGQLPVVNVPAWGNTLYSGQSAVLTHFRSDNVSNPIGDGNSLGLAANVFSKEALVFPNPSDNTVTISLDQAAIKTITVSTMEGRTALEKNFSNGERKTELDISSLSKGIYIIRIEDTNKKIVVEKFIRK